MYESHLIEDYPPFISSGIVLYNFVVIAQQTQYVESMLVYAYYAEPTLKQNRFNVLCLLGVVPHKYNLSF